MLALRSCSKALAGQLLASKHELGAAHRLVPPTHRLAGSAPADKR